MDNQSHFSIAQQTLLEPAELSSSRLEHVLSKMLSPQVDEAELYLQSSHHESWILEDRHIKNGRFGLDQGAGLRAVSGEKTGFAYTDDLLMPHLTEAASAAGSIVHHQGGQQAIPSQRMQPAHQLYANMNPLNSLEQQRKIDLLYQLDDYVRRQDERVKQVVIGLSGLYEVVLIMNSNGTLATDVRPLVRINVDVIAEENGRRERGFSGGGGRFGYQRLIEQDRAFDYAREAVRQALTNLEAVDAPAGTMPVVLGSGWPGVLLHEAVGHGLEGDANRKQSSVFSGRLGEQVASSQCTVVDDGSLAERRGSLGIDDEGTAAQRTVLIENGVLKNYMQDQLNARLMGMQPTGNARRESYAHVPMPRMTNTFMLPGKYQPEEIVRSVKRGLYAVNFDGGQVDTTSGKFVFSANEAYLIEDGQVTKPVKGATLIGNGAEILKQVSMVGNDLQLDTGMGVCGKEGQSVPVGVGQPTLKVDELTVGGTH